MKIALWIIQILLAVAFFGAGFMKTVTPIAELAVTLPYVLDIPVALTRFIGVAEIAGAIGVVLPALTRIQPRLTPLAAGGLGLVMIFAAIFHLTRGEFSGIVPNIILLALAGFVYYGRTKLAPIAPR